MQQTEIQLAGKTYIVERLPVLPHARWAAEHEAVCKPVGEMAIAMGVRNPTPDTMARMAIASGLLIDLEALLNAVCAYSLVLEADREYIGNHAYMEDMLACLMVFFFGAPPMKATAGAAPA